MGRGPHGRSAEGEPQTINRPPARVDRDSTTGLGCGIPAEGREDMSVQELKRRVADGYDVDPRLVAEAMLRRNGLMAVANAIAGEPPLSDGGRTRAADLPPRAGGPRLAQG